MCLNATVRFVPSYSTSLLCDACDGANTNYEFRWQLTDAAAQWCAWQGGQLVGQIESLCGVWAKPGGCA